MFLYGNISRVSEIVCTLFFGEQVEEITGLLPSRFDGARFGGAHQVLQLGEDLLNWIKVRTVGRQEEQVRARGADDVAGFLTFVTAEIVEDHDISFRQGGSQLRLDVERKEFAIDGAFHDPWCRDAIAAKRRDECHRLPMTKRH